MQGITKLIAGDSLDFVTEVPAYPASQGWTLKYRLVPRFSTPTQTPITITCSAYEVDAYRGEAVPGTTANWIPGAYSWSSWVEKSGQRVTLEQGGELQMLPDPAAIVQGTDLRSEAEQALAAVNAILKGKATTAVESYTINGRSLKSYSLSDLMALQAKLVGDVTRERRAAEMSAGRPNPGRYGVRLARV